MITAKGSLSLRTIAIELFALLAIVHIAGYIKVQSAASEFFGNDSFMHLVRLQHMLQEGSLWATTLPDLNAPFGMAFHWTMPYDLFVLGLTALVAPFMGWQAALIAVAKTVVGPLCHLLSGLALLWALSPIIRGWPLRVIVLSSALAPNFVGYSISTRVDHHLFILAALFFWFGSVIRVILNGKNYKVGILAGFSAAASIWVSLEVLPGFLWGLACIGVAWILNPQEIKKGFLAFLFSLPLWATLFLLIDPPPTGLWDAQETYRLSIVSVSFLYLVSVGWIMVLLGSKFLTHVYTRFLSLFVSIVVALIVFTFLFPVMTSLSESLPAIELMKNYLSEYKSPLKSHVSTLFFVLFSSFVGLPLAFFLAYQDRKKPWNWAWLLFLVGMVGYLFLGLKHLRLVFYTAAFSWVPIAIASFRLTQFLQSKSIPFFSLARTLIFFTVLIGPYIPGLAIAMISGPIDKSGEPKCHIREVASTLNDPNFINPFPSIIASNINDASGILYYTPHGAISGPYGHYESLRDSADLFFAKLAEEARSIVDKRGLDYLLICPPSPVIFVEVNEDSILEKVKAGNAPNWMERVDWPENVETLYQLYRFKK